jgi:SAM-dependent methyltransferase
MESRSHRSGGVYRLFEQGPLYELLQRGLGSAAGRRRLAREFVRPSREARILDIGCGTGAILDHLPADVAYVGFDINPKYIAQARARHGHRGQFFVARIEDTAEVGDGFDLVLALGILHHLGDRGAATLIATAHRLLRPGGVLVSCDPVRHAGQSAVARLLIALDRGRCVRTDEGYRGLAAERFAVVEATRFAESPRIVDLLLQIGACELLVQRPAGASGAVGPGGVPALDEFTPSNGATVVVPASHQLAAAPADELMRVHRAHVAVEHAAEIHVEGELEGSRLPRRGRRKHQAVLKMQDRGLG